MEETTNPIIDKIETLPSVPTVRQIKLPDGKLQPLLYAPITVNISKPAGLMLGIGIFLLLSVCTVSNICMLVLGKFIVFSVK